MVSTPIAKSDAEGSRKVHNAGASSIMPPPANNHHLLDTQNCLEVINPSKPLVDFKRMYVEPGSIRCKANFGLEDSPSQVYQIYGHFFCNRSSSRSIRLPTPALNQW